MRIITILSFLAFLFIPNLVHAETHVFSNDLRFGASWNKAGSPYILEEQIYIPDGYSLNITQGTTIMPASSTELTESMVFDGDFSVWGSSSAPVIFQDLAQITLSRNNVDIQNAVFDRTNLSLRLSTSTMREIIIKNNDTAIYSKASNITIEKSEIINNRIGIGSYENLRGPFLMRVAPPTTIATLEGMPSFVLDTEQNIISITDSIIENNSDYQIENQIVNPIEAKDNWWGSNTQPDKIFGQVNVTPWKSKNPKGGCCSNVLFFPGIEASRLYTTGNQLWEPNRNDDVRKMYLDNTGKSLDQNIYTSDILDSAMGFKNIYKSFIAMMNGVVAEKTINEWLPFPYDWRMSVEDIVYGQTKLATTSVSLIDEVIRLADNSKTGKVILIAHSNGGLVAKTLTKALEERGLNDIIEKVIYIAVPELGTPQAILSMLHGHNQSIALGLIVSEDNARKFSQNMKSAYALLPSKKFFSPGPLKVISDLFSNPIEKVASTYNAMSSFLLNNSFSNSTTTNTDIPLLLNKYLFDSANITHSKIDSWKPGTTTKTVSIIGWGLPTSQGIQYEKDKHCFLRKCDIAYSPITTSAGDGTVMTLSAKNISDRNLFINLKQINQDTKQGINHADILEGRETLDLVKNEISTSTTSYGKYISEKEPIDNDKWLTLKIYSPIDLEIFDKDGNTNIPASYYEDFGKIKFATLPYRDDYKIVLKGTDTGLFTIDSQITQNGKILSKAVFEDLPATINLNAELNITTTTQSLSIDANGDGITEYSIDNKKIKKNIKKKLRRILKGKFHHEIDSNREL